jgi:D-alanyl-D-alanine carboxypeptidase
MPAEVVAGADPLARRSAPAEVASRAATAAEGLIVLTSSDTEEESAEAELAGRSALPEVVTRVSTSGGRVWSIDLGVHPSRFDAERVAIRAALAETAILSTGLRRVSPRAGRFAAGIHSLTEEEAEIACLRLSARGHACEVIHP